METCCLIVVVAVIGLIIYSISSSVSEKNAEKEKKIKNYIYKAFTNKIK